MVDDLRALVREALGKKAQPTAAILDAQTLRSTSESGDRAGLDGNKFVKRSKVHIAVDTLGNLLTPDNVQERSQVGLLLEDVQAVTGHTVTKAHGVELTIVKVPDAVRGFVILPKRWIVERSFAWFTSV